MENILGLLPPVFASISGLIPLIWKASPISLPESLIPLASVIYVVAIWIIYLLTLITGIAWSFFNPGITVLFLSVGLVLLVVLLLIISLTEKPSALFNGIIFVIGSLFILIGFTNHISSKDKTAFIFSEIQDCASFEVLWEDKQSQRHKLGLINSFWGTGIIWEEKTANEIIHQFSIECKNGKSISISLLDMKYYTWGMGKAYVYSL